MARWTISLALLFMASCDFIPKDANGTVERIQKEQVLRVGLVAGTHDSGPGRQIIAHLAEQWGARVEWHAAPASLALDSLEKGDLDLVVGEFARASPLKKEVSFSKAVGQPEPKDGKLPVLRLARAHGENDLITTTDELVMP